MLNPLGDLDGVRGRALAKVVAHAPEGEGVRRGDIFADSTDVNFVGVVAVVRSRVDFLGEIVHEHDAGH